MVEEGGGVDESLRLFILNITLKCNSSIKQITIQCNQQIEIWNWIKRYELMLIEWWNHSISPLSSSFFETTELIRIASHHITVYHWRPWCWHKYYTLNGQRMYMEWQENTQKKIHRKNAIKAYPKKDPQLRYRSIQAYISAIMSTLCVYVYE